MTRALNAVKELAPAAFAIFALVATFMDDWSKATFYMSMACFLVLIGGQDDA